ncbi:hypothetical protein LCGC14_1393620, partial [marine sediment metagenome]
YNEASLEIAGVGASLAGRHYDVIKKDDLVSQVNATTRLQRDKVVEWHQYSVSLFDNPANRMDHIVGTRYAFDDLYGRIIAGEELTLYDYMRRSAIEDGEPIFPLEVRSADKPTGYSLESLEQLKFEQGSWLYSCQYLNEPVPPGEQDFPVTENNYYREKPEYDPSQVFMGVDPAVSESTKADYTAMVVTAVDREGNVYVLDYIRERLLPDKLIVKLFDFYNKWKPRRMALEKEAFQVALNHWIRQEAARRGTSLPIYEVVQPRDKSKEMRIRGLQPRWEAGALKIAPWMRDLEAELTSFPRGQHDDLLDALVMQHEFWPIKFPTAEAKRAEGMFTLAAILDEIKNAGGQTGKKFVHLQRRSRYDDDASGSEEGSHLQVAPFRGR